MTPNARKKTVRPSNPVTIQRNFLVPVLTNEPRSMGGRHARTPPASAGSIVITASERKAVVAWETPLRFSHVLSPSLQSLNFVSSVPLGDVSDIFESPARNSNVEVKTTTSRANHATGKKIMIAVSHTQRSCQSLPQWFTTDTHTRRGKKKNA